MNQPGDPRLSTDAELEVELSAQDLIGLTPLPATEPARGGEAVASSAPPLATVAAGPAANTESVAKPSAQRRSGTSRMAGMVAAAAVVSLVAIVSVAELAPAQKRIERPVSNWTPIPDAPAVEEPVVEEPTLVANPFDPNEVFELPAGTSEEEGRAIVAEMLVKRANERQVFSRGSR